MYLCRKLDDKMKKILLMVIAAMMVTTNALAQFPDDVKEVLKKCDEKMANFAGKVTLIITKITKGCSDNWFKLDMNKYKNAVVVRR